MSHVESPRERAERFLEIAGDFRLGDLVTELSHPRSTDLSQTARQDTAAGLGVLFDVDRDVVEAYRIWAQSGQPGRMAAAAVDALRGGGKLFFTGCGATGRLSIQLDAIWRAFWQGQGDVRLKPDATRGADTTRWQDRTRSVMAGGDFALIKSVEGFEDFVPFGRKQIADLGVAAGDVVFAITEGGETSFVIGTAWQGLDAGARVFFVYNNPDDVLRAHVRRSREVIDDPRIEKVNLTTGPMAVTGSTRMQATSSELLAMMTVLEMVVRQLLADAGALDPGMGDAADVPRAMIAGVETVHAQLAGAPLREALAALVEREEAVYRAGARTSYFAGALGVDVLTDTTERSPTFCTPAFRKRGDTDAADSWTFLFTDEADTERAWPRLLRRAPQTIEWSDDDLLTLLDEETAAKQSAVLHEIGLAELLRFRIGLDGLNDRPFRRGDAALAVLSAAADRHLIDPAGGTFAQQLARARAAGTATGIVGVGRAADLRQLDGAARAAGFGLDVALEVPATPFLLDPLTRIGVKWLLNALSTCTMVRLGRVLGNRMIWVVPSNLKLIDRSTRYIRDLAGVSYDDACHALFEVIEYIEPRRRAGQVYPAPVGVATMRLRHHLSLEDAEARLFQELQ